MYDEQYFLTNAKLGIWEFFGAFGTVDARISNYSSLYMLSVKIAPLTSENVTRGLSVTLATGLAVSMPLGHGRTSHNQPVEICE